MILSLQPWRRAPFLLWRRRPVAFVLAAAAAILAAAAASGPLFVSSAGDATLAQQLDQGCRQGVALHSPSQDLFQGFASGPDPLAQQMFDLHTTARVNTVGALAHLGPPVRELYAMHLHVTRPGDPADTAGAYVTAMSKTGDLDNVEILARSPGGSDSTSDGVWLADTTAAAVHAKPGDTVVFDNAMPSGASVKLRVAGIFKDLQTSVAPPFWCDDLSVIYASGNSARFPLALVDVATADKLGHTLPANLVDETNWAVDSAGLTVGGARRLDAQLDALTLSLPQAIAQARSAAAQAYQRNHPAKQLDSLLDYDSRELAATSFDLPAHRAQFVSAVLPSTVLPITVAAIVIALLLVGGSASFWFERRRREVDVLLAHGVAPWALGTKAVLESSLPVLAGAVGGFFGGSLLVRAVGPSSVISGGAQHQAVLFAAVATLCGFGCIAMVATLRCVNRERLTAPHKSRILRLPWDVVVPGVAAGVLAWMSPGGTTVNSTQGGVVARIDPVVLVVPLLAFVAATALAGRLGVLALRLLRSRGQRLPSSAWLAWRRITGMPGAAALLLGAVALPTAVAVYGATVNTSVHRTLDDQDHLLIGADVVIDLTGPAAVPAALEGRASLVLRRDHPALDDVLVSVVGVDPADFARNVFWDGAMPGTSIRKLVGKLRDDGPGRPLVGIFSGPIPAHSTLRFVENGSDVHVPVDVVATPPRIPGEQGGYPVLLVDRTALERYTTSGSYEFWIRGNAASAVAALDAAGIAHTHVGAASQVTDGSYVQPVAYTFSFLDALVTLAGAVGAGALLLYLDARARTRRVAYVLTRRMGLSRAAHLTSILIELAATMLAGIAVGVGVAAIATGLLRSRFNVDPGIPPSTVLGWPVHATVIDVVVVLVVLVLASGAAQWASERAKPAEVLREA